jgi:NifU-like protein involved in Fe-S cluster formation
MKLHLRVKDGRVIEATYETYQCPGSHACGKALCDMLTGRSLEEARALRHGDLVERVGPLPAHRRNCYGLALLSLSDALGKMSSCDGNTTPGRELLED